MTMRAKLAKSNTVTTVPSARLYEDDENLQMKDEIAFMLHCVTIASSKSHSFKNSFKIHTGPNLRLYSLVY